MVDGVADLEINVDPDALEKIVLNLIGNSLKFTDAGGSVRVAVNRGESDGVCITVRDTGVGLEKRELTRIFDRFAQVDSSATRKHEGTGIGLALTRELVALHDGQIWAESRGVGFGTTIHVRLPIGEAGSCVDEALLVTDGEALDPTVNPLSAESTPETTARVELQYCELSRTVEKSSVGVETCLSKVCIEDNASSTILVCEDNPDMRRLLGDLLAKEFNVRFAKNGREGLDAVESDEPDLVLTDVMMPEMSGVELCARLKRNPGTRGIPVILITSKAEREMKIQGLESGADDYITKPFHSRELLARVRSLVRLRTLQGELTERNRALKESNDQLAGAMAELKEAETNMVQAERLAAVGELAAGIAHEINNPLNFAKSAAGAMGSFLAEFRAVIEELRGMVGSDSSVKLRALVESRELDETIEGLEELGGIVSEGLSRTGQLVGDLRDLSAPTQDDRGTVDMAKLLESALQLTRHVFQSDDIRVIANVDASLPMIHGDGRALGQVLLNILKNAAEAFEERGGCVVVELSSVDEGVLISVKDNASGVAPDIRERLFDPFFSTKPAGQGTGLGLSICRRVVTEHRGIIEVRSAVGKGAEFRIWLPAVAA